MRAMYLPHPPIAPISYPPSLHPPAASQPRLPQAGAMKPTPGHAALRTGRASMAGGLYLITTTTAGRLPLFRDWPVARTACASLTQPILWRGSRLLCWTLMPDHWHALVELGDADALDGLVNRVKSASARAINRCMQRKGRVWSKAFHDRALREEDDLLATARYIVANPLRAGLVRSVAAYPYWDAVWLGSGRSEQDVASIARMAGSYGGGASLDVVAAGG